jgi:hypothetical protein
MLCCKLLIFILSPGTPIILLQINIWGFEGDLRITTSPLSYLESFEVMCSDIMMSSEYIVGSIEGPEHYGYHNKKITLICIFFLNLNNE